MVTNEIRRLRRQLELMDEEGANQLLSSLLEFKDELKKRNPDMNYTPYGIIMFYKGEIRERLRKITPKTKQTKINYDK